jgi:hypothetical protein
MIERKSPFMSTDTKCLTLPLDLVFGLRLADIATGASSILRKDFHTVKIKKRITSANTAQTAQEESAFG